MVLTRAHLDRYTNGQCHALAEALARLTGGTMVLCSDDDGATGHCMTRVAGGFLDVTGLHTWEDMLALGWHADDLTPVTSAEALGWEAPDLGEETFAVARAIAEGLR
ncbi:hypothetical protein AB0I28_32220 [Phytomonospora sp. NPDC050363]|uniref:hypothetical protein n=1 Tax=Phytomonospora sp. NPDC050363 TaxID=3155642 RepID=UPI0033E9FFBC